MIGKSLLPLTERDRQVLRLIEELGLVTREQLAALGFFKSKTRANTRLKQLCKANYLDVLKVGQDAGAPFHAYRLGREAGGTRRFGATSQFFVRHQLGIGDVRIAFATRTALTRWLADSELASLKLGVVSDAYLEYEVNQLTYAAFLEYDRGTEPSRRIAAKVDGYLKLAFGGEFARVLKRRYFRVFLITDSLRRLLQLQSQIASRTDRIFWLTTLSELKHQGPLASIWRRPGVSDTKSLIA